MIQRVAARLLLISHSGRFCSAGSLLFAAAKSLARDFVIDICFPVESPRPEVASAYAQFGARIVPGPGSGYALTLANCQATADFVAYKVGASTGPVIMWIHESWMHRDPDTLDRAFARSTAIIFQSEFQPEEIYAGLLRGKSARIYVRPNAIREDDPPACEPRMGRPLIVSVGSIIPRKRHRDLAAALVGLAHDVECWLLGAAKTAAAAAEVFEHGAAPNLVLKGHIENQACRAIIQAATILVHPSESESQPLTLLEAMRYGVPMIIADLSAYRYMGLRGGVNCLTYPAGDVSALRERLERLLDRPEEGGRLSRAAQALYQERYTMRAFEDGVREIISDVVGHLSSAEDSHRLG